MSEWEGIGLQQLLLQRLHWQYCSEDLRTGFGVAGFGAEAAEGLAGCCTASARRHHALMSSSIHQGVDQP